MSIVLNEVVQVRPWGGFLERELPIGTWFHQMLLEGDASAGVMSLRFNLTQTGVELSPNMYSLEQLSIETTTPDDRQVLIGTENLEPLLNSKWRVGVDGPAALLPAEAGLIATTLLPLFLGSQRIPGASGVFTVDMINVNGLTLSSTAQGYVWGSRSRSAPGGPRRPIQSLFGRS